MGDRRSSTIPMLSEEQKSIKKKAEAMLVKSENNWNKITPEMKEILNSPTSAFFYSIERSVLNEMFENFKGSGVGELESIDNSVEFAKGKLFVNAADPANLSWTVFKKNEKVKNKVMKVNFFKISQSFTGIRDNLAKDLKQICTVGSSPPGISNYDDEFNIYEFTGKENLNFFSEGKEAEKLLMYINKPEETIDPDCLFLISTQDIMLFILFRTPKIALEWSVALKILLKAQNLSYRGTKEDYPNKKKEYVKEIMKDKEVKIEPKLKNILFWILDLETDSYLYREVKIYFWCRGGETSTFFIFDMRKPIRQQGKLLDMHVKNETYMTKLLIFAYLNDLEISRFFLLLQQDSEVNLESKHLGFKDQKDQLLTVDHTDFWKTRRKIRKKYQNLVLKSSWLENKKREEDERKLARMEQRRNRKKRKFVDDNEPKIEDRFDIHCKKIQETYNKLISSIDLQINDEENQNELLKALKILQLQKQIIRSKLVRISTIRDTATNKYRGKRAGGAIRTKELKTTEKVAKKAYTAASNVLKIMMFEETIPGLIPEQIRDSMKNEEKKRDGCCRIF